MLCSSFCITSSVASGLQTAASVVQMWAWLQKPLCCGCSPFVLLNVCTCLTLHWLKELLEKYSQLEGITRRLDGNQCFVSSSVAPSVFRESPFQALPAAVEVFSFSLPYNPPLLLSTKLVSSHTFSVERPPSLTHRVVSFSFNPCPGEMLEQSWSLFTSPAHLSFKKDFRKASWRS